MYILTMGLPGSTYLGVQIFPNIRSASWPMIFLIGGFIIYSRLLNTCLFNKPMVDWHIFDGLRKGYFYT